MAGGDGGTTTASNGLTKTGDDIALGGTLTKNTVIVGAHNIIFNGQTAFSVQAGNINLQTITSALTLNAGGLGGGIFSMSALGARFQDTKAVGTQEGIKYAASGYVTQPLSLTTKEWVEALFAVPVKFPSYTVATLPTATAAQQIYVSDETGGAVMAFSDGTNWRRCTDRVIVS